MRFQSGCSLGSAGHLGPRQLSPNNSSLQPLRSSTSAAEAVFFVPLDADLKVRSTRTSRIHQFWNRSKGKKGPPVSGPSLVNYKAGHRSPATNHC